MNILFKDGHSLVILQTNFLLGQELFVDWMSEFCFDLLFDFQECRIISYFKDNGLSFVVSILDLNAENLISCIVTNTEFTIALTVAHLYFFILSLKLIIIT